MNAQLTTARATLLALLAVAAATRGQSPLVTTSTLSSFTFGCQGSPLGSADFDGNGRADVLLYSTGILRVALDAVLPSGTCVTTQVPAPQVYLSGSMIANLDGDAHPDVLVGIPSANWILDAYGNGAGGFTVPGTGPYTGYSGTNLKLAAVHDFDLDGRDDAVIIREQFFGYPIVEVHRNLGPGWSQIFGYQLGAATAFPYQYGAGDVDGDGYADVVWVEDQPGVSQSQLRIARGGPGGTFTVDTISNAIAPMTSARIDAVVDLDADGFDDVLVRRTTGWTQWLEVVYGVPAPALGTFVSTPIAPFFYGNAAVVDFDRDGVLDVVVEGGSNSLGYAHAVALLRGLGNRQFTAPHLLSYQAVSSYGWGSTVAFLQADFDGDLDADVFWWPSLVPLKLLQNRTVYAPGCPGTGGVTPSLHTGIATPGNGAFGISLASAPALAPAVLGISLASVPASGCGLAISALPAHLVSPAGSFGLTTTGAAGGAVIGIPLPAPPALSGLAAYAQWAVADPAGSFQYLGVSFALSEAHTILVW